jgi:hypothetical protein
LGLSGGIRFQGGFPFFPPGILEGFLQKSAALLGGGELEIDLQLLLVGLGDGLVQGAQPILRHLDFPCGGLVLLGERIDFARLEFVTRLMELNGIILLIEFLLVAQVLPLFFQEREAVAFHLGLVGADLGGQDGLALFQTHKRVFQRLQIFRML